MAKIKNNYFELMKMQAEYCVETSEILEKLLCDFSPDKIAAIRQEIHSVEHTADELHHDIITKLFAEFITPIDQEDILRLVQIIDDITDALDEVVLDFYMYDIKVLPKGADVFSRIVTRCVKALAEAVAELKNFKRPEMLRKLLIEVNTIEGEADAAHTEAIHNIFASDADAKTLIGGKAIYGSLENCCDLCEHAADVIEQIIIKNT